MHKPSMAYEKPEVVVLWGPTGVGKSRLARSYQEDFYVKSSLTEKWWDGYDNQDMVIWDDFRGSDIKFSHLLQLIDGYGAQVQVKGAVIWLKPKKWVFTSSKAPEQWYSETLMGDGENTNQLLRRITTIIEIKEHIDFNAQL